MACNNVNSCYAKSKIHSLVNMSRIFRGCYVDNPIAICYNKLHIFKLEQEYL